MINFQIQATPTLHTGSTIPHKDAQSDPAMLTPYYPRDGCRGAYLCADGGDAGFESVYFGHVLYSYCERWLKWFIKFGTFAHIVERPKRL